MIQELLTYFLPIAKFILATALMVVFYNLLYKEKTSFNRCRIYLLSIAFVSLLLSQFNIVVYTPPARIVEVPTSISGVPFTSETMSEQPMNVVSSNAVEEPTFMERLGAYMTIKNVLIAIYLLVTIGLLVSLFIQLFQILATKQKGKITHYNGYEIVVSSCIPTPFSFFKSIYIGDHLSDSKLELILKHEQWHIKHLHYLDVLVMELLVRIFWFNPVLWWVRKELRNVSEFQADRSVLDEGHDLYKYQTIIMEEVMEHNPYLANGFNNSFTKKRFIMMKNKCQTSFTTLRRALLIPFLAIVFAALSLSVGKSQVKYVIVGNTENELVRNTIVKESVMSKIETIDSHSKNLNDSTKPFKNMTSVLISSFIDITKSMNRLSIELALASEELERLAKMNKPSYNYEEIKKVFELLNLKICIGKTKDFATLSDNYIATINSTELKKSAENFRIIKTEIDALRNDTSGVDKSYILKRLMMSIHQDNFVSNAFADVMKSANGLPVSTSTINSFIDESIKKSPNFPESDNVSKAPVEATTVDPYEEAMRNGYRLKPEQIKVLDIPYSDICIYSIEKTKQETRITLATPIISEGYWVRFSRDFRIIDPKTKDTYMIRKLENNIPLSEFIFAPGTKNKMIAITLIFPPLKESIKQIHLLEVQEPDAYMPSNSGSPYQFINVVLDDYIVPGSRVPKIYR